MCDHGKRRFVLGGCRYLRLKEEIAGAPTRAWNFPRLPLALEKGYAAGLTIMTHQLEPSTPSPSELGKMMPEPTYAPVAECEWVPRVALCFPHVFSEMRSRFFADVDLGSTLHLLNLDNSQYGSFC